MAIDAVEIVRCPARVRGRGGSFPVVLCEFSGRVCGVLWTVGCSRSKTSRDSAMSRFSLRDARRRDLRRGLGTAAIGQYRRVLAATALSGRVWADCVCTRGGGCRGHRRNLGEMVQVFLSAPAAETVRVLKHVGFRHIADLRYMTAESSRFPLAAPPGELDYVPYHGTQRGRLLELVARTYEGTLDCRELDGVRDLDHVINGYQGTGVFRPENWLFVRSDGRDVGVLLLADHPQGRHWELMYTAACARGARTWLGEANCALCAVVGTRGEH